MNDDPFSLLCDAILKKRRVTFRIGAARFDFAPHVLYEGPRGLTLSGVTHYDVPLHPAVAQLEDVAATMIGFRPDPTFDLADPQYAHAYASVGNVKVGE